MSPMTGLAEPNGTPNASAAPATPETGHDTATDTLAIPQQKMQALPDEDLKQQNWGQRVYHGVLNALGGANDVSLARDPQTGKMVATAVKSGPGQQWKRIISGALAGFGAAEEGAGTGPGSISRGAGLGIEAGTKQVQQQQQQQRQQANEDFEMQQKTATGNAQNALLNHQITAATYNLGRSQVEAAFQDAERENAFASAIQAGGEGSTDLGIFPDFKSVVAAAKAMPQLHGHQANGQIVGIPHVGADNKIDGMHYALVTPDWLGAKTTKDTKLYQLKPPEKPGQQPTVEAFTVPAGSITNDQWVKAQMASTNQVMGLYTAEQKEQDEQTRLKQEESRTTAENASSYATANKENADAETLKAAGAGGPDGSTSVDLIGSGQMAVGRMAYLLSRNPALANAVATKYPGFDSSKVDAYAKAYTQFTTGKIAGQLNAGDAVLKHLLHLSELNTPESHIWGTPDYRAYQTQLDVVASDLGNFYGDSTIPAAAERRKNLGGIGPGRQKAIQTQARAMGEKLDAFAQEWKNSSPSAIYEAHMPGISGRALTALQQLDPDYDQRTLKEIAGARRDLVQGTGAQPPQQQQQPPQAGPAGAVKITPGEPTAQFPDGTTRVARGGQWVVAQH